MPTKPLIILPDPLLRQVSKPIERVDADLQRLADDMLETMYDAPGIGLAAIQIGLTRAMYRPCSHAERRAAAHGGHRRFPRGRREAAPRIRQSGGRGIDRRAFGI